MEVNAVMPVVPTYMNWSEQEITWSRKDTPRIMPSPGKYALGDPMQPAAEAGARNRRREPINNRLGPRCNDRQEFGQKRREPDYPYPSNQVAAVNPDQPGAGGVQRPKTNGPAWSPNQAANTRSWQDPQPPLTYESMLDGPCRYHTTDPRKPANHSTRQCSWNHRIREEGAKAGANRGAPPRQFPQKLWGPRISCPKYPCAYISAIP